MEAIRSANRLVVGALDSSSTTVVLTASFTAGAAWGVFARVWMRFITAHEEFSWFGTGLIVVGFGVAFVGQAGVYLARRVRTSRGAFIGLRVLAIATLIPLATGAGAFGFPVIVLAPLAITRSGWSRWLRVLLGVLALLVAVGVAATLFSDLHLIRAIVGSAWFAVIYAVLVWAVCFSFAAQDDQRFTQNISDPEPKGVTPTPHP